MLSVNANRTFSIPFPVPFFKLLPCLQLVMENLPHEYLQFHREFGFPESAHMSVYNPPMSQESIHGFGCVMSLFLQTPVAFIKTNL
jgi:hypothetical protein